MVVCDTHALLFWAIAPERLPARAADVMASAQAAGELACADISFWEIGMLAKKGRIRLPIPLVDFLTDLIDALRLTVVPIDPAIASVAQEDRFAHGDPADRLIGATAAVHQAPLVSADEKLAQVSGLNVIWS